MREISEDERQRMPDFFIGGAMKSGTTSLRYLLRQHDSVFMPDRELHFFDVDDFYQHTSYFPEDDGRWVFQDWESHFERYFEWYIQQFVEADTDRTIGEDSSTYLASRKTPARIASLLPDAKLIFCLRNPVDRTYSQYWHWLRNGWAIYDFERTLQYMPRGLIERSQYLRQSRRYLDCFDRDQIKFILFERFIDRTQAVIDEVCDFLDLAGSLNVERYETHQHPAKAPRSLRLQLFLNRCFRDYTAERHYGDRPGMPSERFRPITKLFYKGLFSLNLTDSESPPPMREHTREFLERYFARELKGLGQLIGRDLTSYWPFLGRSD